MNDKTFPIYSRREKKHLGSQGRGGGGGEGGAGAIPYKKYLHIPTLKTTFFLK